MQNKIVVRTDASHKPGLGVGVAFESVIYFEDGSYERMKSSRYIEKKMTTTDAEEIAVAFGIYNIYQKIDERDEFEVVVESDCEYAVSSVKDCIEEEYEGKVKRLIRFLIEPFDEFKVRWIPRSDNQKADAIARQALEEGTDYE